MAVPGTLVWHLAKRLTTLAATTPLPRRDIPPIPRQSDSTPDDLFAFISQLQLPANFWWWIILLVLNLLYIVPLCIFLSYAVNNLWPLLCIIESDSRSSYEPIALQDVSEENGPTQDDDAPSQPPVLVTQSLRALNKKLYSIAGWPALLRGLRPHMVFNFACLIIAELLAFVPMMPSMLAVALAPLFVVQLYTGWVHVTISAPRPESFRQRMPAFKSCFQLTALPTLVLWLAVAFSQQAPLIVISVLHVQMEDPTGLDLVPLPVWHGSSQDYLMVAAVVVAYFLPTVLFVIPAHAVLTRVQASSLPSRDEPIVSIDPAIRWKTTDKEGYDEYQSRGVSMLEAWRSFPHTSWWRLTKMYAKMLLITLSAEIFMASTLIAQFMLLWAGSGYSDDSLLDTSTSIVAVR